MTGNTGVLPVARRASLRVHEVHREHTFSTCQHVLTICPSVRLDSNHEQRGPFSKGELVCFLTRIIVEHCYIGPRSHVVVSSRSSSFDVLMCSMTGDGSVLWKIVHLHSTALRQIGNVFLASTAHRVAATKHGKNGDAKNAARDEVLHRYPKEVPRFTFVRVTRTRPITHAVVTAVTRCWIGTRSRLDTSSAAFRTFVPLSPRTIYGDTHKCVALLRRGPGTIETPCKAHRGNIKYAVVATIVV